ncbi:MAG: S46 family peptidase [Ignavibacteriales bacterium]|nr:S46 family peptidase [Ignavibacteriales bacterium]
MNLFQNKLFAFTSLIFALNIYGQAGFYEPINLEEVKWSMDDFGRMWTFDNVPIDDFKNKYGFNPSKDWLLDVQKSALQFGGGCSAAFVSSDGLIMTNHHCGRNQLSEIQNEGEDLLKDGFYAESLEDERKVEGLFVDQLIFIEDVTEEIKNFMNTGKSDDEKINLKEQIKDSLEAKYELETGLNCRIITLYHGGKYSLYGYKRYNDIRLVMAPDFQIAATGWDWDNFTYPRYELDFMFYRAYDENGIPIKNENFFKWSKNGAEEGEPIFVVGRPGSTDRLISFAQLEFLRDYSYKESLIGFNAIYNAYFDLYQKNTEKEDLLLKVMSWGNARKSYAGRLAGLKNSYIMKKKLDFENDLKKRVNESTELNEKYGEIWNSIKIVLDELKQNYTKNNVYRFNKYRIKPELLNIAGKLINLAEQKKLPIEEREEGFKDENLELTITNIFPDSIDYELEYNLLIAHKTFLTKILGAENELVNILYNSVDNSDIDDLLKRKINSRENVYEIAELSADEILNLDEPFIKFTLEINKMYNEIKQNVEEQNNTLNVLNQSLGEVISLVYGNTIPPDATSSLRISDGVIKGYEYNGTIAPGKTTYYGLWDRYESFNKKTYPWGLHERWKVPPKDLDLAAAIGFASTNDIVGGNSGSSVININKEVVGLVHDGNIESLAGHTIFLEENNRTVATDSKGLIEALKYVYKTNRLVDELIEGEIK